MLIFFTAVFISSFIRAALYFDEGARYVMTYVTNISMLMLVIYLLIGVIHASKDRGENDSISKWLRGFHVLACTSQPVVVVFYWGLIAPESLANYPDWCDFLFYCHFQNICVHGLGLIPTIQPLVV